MATGGHRCGGRAAAGQHRQGQGRGGIAGRRAHGLDQLGLAPAFAFSSARRARPRAALRPASGSGAGAAAGATWATVAQQARRSDRTGRMASSARLGHGQRSTGARVLHMRDTTGRRRGKLPPQRVTKGISTASTSPSWNRFFIERMRCAMADSDPPLCIGARARVRYTRCDTRRSKRIGPAVILTTTGAAAASVARSAAKNLRRCPASGTSRSPARRFVRA